MDPAVPNYFWTREGCLVKSKGELVCIFSKYIYLENPKYGEEAGLLSLAWEIRVDEI
jgi:hypothetical protein